MPDIKNEMLKNRARLHLAQAALSYYLECFGDSLAKKQEFADIDGIEAIHHYLTLKHNWLPSQVKDLSHTVLRELLNKELQAHELAQDEIAAFALALEAEYKRR